MSEITLSKAVRSNLLNLQSTADLLSKSQERLSTGLRVNSALDNPTNFFTAQGLNSRASDLSQLLDAVSNAVQTVAAADKGISAITKLVESAQATARQALQTAATIPASAAVNAVVTSGNTTGVTITGSVTGTTATDTTADLSAFTASDGVTGTTATDTTADLTSFTVSDGVVAAPAELTGVAVADGSVDAISNGFADGGTLTFSDGTTTLTFDFNDATTNGAYAGSNIGIDVSAGIDIDTVLAAIQTELQNAGGAFASATISASSGNIVASLGSNTTDSLTIAGTAATGLGINGTDAPTAAVDDTSGTIVINGQNVALAAGDDAAAILGKLQAAATASGTGANQFTVTDNSDGTFTLNGSNGNDLVISGLSTEQASALGLANGTINGDATVADTSGTFTINGQNVAIAAGDDAAAILGKLQAAATASGTGANQFTVTDNSDGTFTLNGSNGNDLVVAGLTTDQASALGLANGTINGDAAVTGTDGAFTINGQTVTLAGGDDATAILGKLQAAATASSGANAFTVSNNAGVLTITGTAGNDVTIAGLTAGQTTALGLSNGTTDGTPAVTASANPKRAELVNTYNDLLGQIDALAKDSGFNGVNLLNGDNLSVLFNEDGSSKLDIAGITNTSAGLGLTALASTGFDSNASINSTLDDLKGAIDTLRTQASKFGSNLSVVETRQDFTKQMINVLQTGASNLTLADTNEEAANVLALQTRQQLSSTALSLASQADQNVLRLF